MDVTSASHSALQGIQRGLNGLEKAATEIASADQNNGTATRGVAEPLVDQISARNQVEASVKVLKAEDEALGKLIDEIA